MSIDALLERLENAQLLRRLGDLDPTYLFRHTLVQETAYGGQLVKRRRAVHREVVRFYEQLGPESLEEHAALLAQHSAGAGDPERTLRYARLAGDEAFRRNANAEAISHYTTALEIAAGEQQETGGTAPAAALELRDGSSLLTYLYTRRGRALELSGRYEEALANYANMAALAEERGDRPLELAALIAQAIARSTPNLAQNLALAAETAERALELAQALGDQASEARVLWIQSLMGYFAGQPGRAIEQGEQAIAIARRLGLCEQLAYALHDISRSLVAAGQVARARAALEESQALWRELDNRPLLADSLNSLSEMHSLMGEYPAGLTAAEEAARISQAIGNVWGMAYSRMTRGLLLVEFGEFAEAQAAIEAAAVLGQEAGFRHVQVFAPVMLGMIYDALGAPERAQAEVERALATARVQPPSTTPGLLAVQALLQLASGDVSGARATSGQALAGLTFDEAAVTVLAWMAPLPWLADAEIRLAAGAAAEALDAADRLLIGVRRFGIRPSLPEALALRGRALQALGRAGEAWVAMDGARREAEALPCRRVLWRILGTMGDLADGAGDREEAKRMRAEAQAVIAFIADRAGSPELRASFLAREDVRRLCAVPPA